MGADASDMGRSMIVSAVIRVAIGGRGVPAGAGPQADMDSTAIRMARTHQLCLGTKPAAPDPLSVPLS